MRVSNVIVASAKTSLEVRPAAHVRGRIVPCLIMMGASVLLVGCSTSPSDFKSEGEKFLQSPELAQEAGYTFSKAKCENPTSTTIGTQFTCTATDNDGDDWEFVVEITGERELTVVSGDLIN